MRRAIELKLTKEQIEDLQSLQRKHSKNVGLQTRVKIILMANRGKQNKEIAQELNISAHKVGRWRKRYSQWGIVGIERGLPRGANHGGKCTDEQQVLRKRVIDETYWKVPDDAGRWTARSLAERLETNYSFVHRVWTSLGIRPHHIRTLGELNNNEFQVRIKNYVAMHISSKCRLFALDVEPADPLTGFDHSEPLVDKQQRYSLGLVRHIIDQLRLNNGFEPSEIPEGLMNQLSEQLALIPDQHEMHIVGDDEAVLNKLRMAAWAVGNRRVVFHTVPDSDVWSSFADQYIGLLEGMGIESGNPLRTDIERWSSDGTLAAKQPLHWGLSAKESKAEVITLDAWSSVYSR